MKTANIHRGVTLYSFQNKVTSGEMSLEDCVKFCADMGAYGIEVLAQQTFRNCPYSQDAVFDKWDELMWRYGTKPTAFDIFVDEALYQQRSLLKCEKLRLLEDYLKFAKRAGFKIVRMGNPDPWIFENALPLLETYGLKMGREIHGGPNGLNSKSTDEVINIVMRKNSPLLGLIPDMSLFTYRLDTGRYVEMNERIAPELLPMLEAKYDEDREHFKEFCDEEIASGRYTEDEIGVIEMAKGVECDDPEQLRPLIPYTIHVHGKFERMMENGQEYYMDPGYKKVLPMLVEEGYEGYISSEYEAPETIIGYPEDCTGQLKLHQEMMKKLLKEEQ